MGVVDAPEVIVAASREEAVERVRRRRRRDRRGRRDDRHARHHARPAAPAERALLIGRAGLSGMRSEGGRTTIGATTTLAELQDAVEPLGDLRAAASPTSRSAGRPRSAATSARRPGVESPRGDLQAALLVARRAGALDRRRRRAHRAGRGLPRRGPGRAARARRLRSPIRRPAATATRPPPARPRLHVMRVCAARVGGELRVAVSGAGPARRAQPRGRGARSPAAPTRRPPPSACSRTSPLTTTRSRRAGTAARCCRCSSAARSTSCAEGAR